MSWSLFLVCVVMFGPVGNPPIWFWYFMWAAQFTLGTCDVPGLVMYCRWVCCYYLCSRFPDTGIPKISKDLSNIFWSQLLLRGVVCTFPLKYYFKWTEITGQNLFPLIGYMECQPTPPTSTCIDFNAERSLSKLFLKTDLTSYWKMFSSRLFQVWSLQQETWWRSVHCGQL